MVEFLSHLRYFGGVLVRETSADTLSFPGIDESNDGLQNRRHG